MFQYRSIRTVLALLFVSVGAFFFVLTILASVPAAAANTTPAGCLECHGPFEKLASAPPHFVAPSGEKINPHRYVPHDLKEIPECVSCHKPHSATPNADELSALPKPNVETCFECHHERNFENCQKCHKKG